MTEVGGSLWYAKLHQVSCCVGDLTDLLVLALLHVAAAPANIRQSARPSLHYPHLGSQSVVRLS